jgi:tetratricopeptide (TPR) repeat protein
LGRLIERCLEKNAEDRFPSVRDVHDGLQALRRELDSGRAALQFAAPASRPAISANPAPSIAVLPFVNMSGDADNEYFSDRLSEDLINALGRLPGLQVASRTSAFRLRGGDLDIRQIGRQLGVATVVEGSVTHAVQRSTKNLDAYELYLKGRHHWHQRSPATLRVAIQCFEQTIKLDPQYALAYAGLADCYGILRVYGWVSADDGRAPAHAGMTQAMALAPSLWEVNFSRAFYTFYFERAWREARRHFLKAIAISPRSSLAQAYYGVFLATEGRAEDAVTHTTLACQLDPLSALIHGLASIKVVGYPLDSGNRSGGGFGGAVPPDRAGRPRPAAGSGGRGLRAGEGAGEGAQCH